MIAPIIQRLANTRASVATLEQSIANELASLPAAYGFDSRESFIAALRAAGRRGGRRAKGAGKKEAPKPRKRALITDRIRAKVKNLFKAGKSGSQIARAVGISLPSVQNIKKAFGLVKARKKPSAAPTARRVPIKRIAPRNTPKKRAASKKVEPPHLKPVSIPTEPPAASTS
jgi:DNA-binding NarL/FixJ family response regulator